jgi:DNA (cytosine-5)-methyltransferase 1
MTLVYGSVCSGIEAASVAWHVMGWRPAFFAEIEPFPRAVLAHHYPEVACHGDFTTIERGQYADIDVLVGGTPCQSFSVAGLRGGLDDERGNLALEFCRLARRLGPRWVVWENVPGVLSMDGGRAFASILGGLAKCGYGLAYRVLDAQFVRVDGYARAVPQRRRRVFVVGHLGSWQRAAAVLFERASLSGHPPPRREAGKGAAPTLAARTRGGGGRLAGGEHDGGTDFDCDGGLIAGTIKGAAIGRKPENGPQRGDWLNDGSCFTLTTHEKHSVAYALNAKGGAGRSDAESETLIPCMRAGGGFDDVAHALRAGGFDASEDGTGRGTPLVPVSLHVAPTLSAGMDRGGTMQDAVGGGLLPVCFDETQITSAENRCNPQPGDPSHPLAAGARSPAIAFNARQDPDVFDGHTGPLDTDGSTQAVCTARVPSQSRACGTTGQPKVQPEWRVRRLTPTECERLQGFPDGYTAIPYGRGGRIDGPAAGGQPKGQASDGPRYKALGNSMAVNVMRWLGRRIEMVDRIPSRREQLAVVAAAASGDFFEVDATGA